MRELLRRLRFFFGRHPEIDGLDEEMRLHRDLRAAQLVKQGFSPEDAAYAAQRQFGNTTLLKENSQTMWTWLWLDDLSKDLRYAARAMRAHALFAAVAILTLALGIGANTAIFSVVNAVLLRRLPVPDPERLFYLRVIPAQPDGAGNTGNSDSSFSEYVFEQLRSHHDVFTTLAAYVPAGIGKTGIRAGALPEEAYVEMVSGDFFTGLGVKPACGQLLNIADEQNHAAVTVLGYGFWMRRFAGDCSVIGKTIYVKGLPFTAIGVAARGFNGAEPIPTDLWLPLQKSAALNAWGSTDNNFYADPNWWCLRLIARLAPGVTPEKAQAILAAPFLHAAYEHLDGKPKPGETPRKLMLSPARGASEGNDYSQPLYFLLAMVGVILLLACGNVALLLAARNTARRREFSIRLALGGGRMRIFRQLLAESLLLTILGAAVGYAFALIATRLLAAWSGLEINFAPDRSVLLFTMLIAAAVALTLGLAPLFGALRVPVGLALKQSSATAFTERSKSSVSRLILIAQIAMGLALATSAGLLTRSLLNVERTNMGLHVDGLLVFGIDPTVAAPTNAGKLGFYATLLDKLRQLPGVSNVTLMDNRIGSGWSNNTGVILDGKERTGDDSHLRWNWIGPDFFATLGVPVLRGRDLRDTDAPTSPKVAIVNETFVKRFLPGREPLGHQVSFNTRTSFAIIGVVADSKYTEMRERPIPTAYFPFTQDNAIGTMHVEMRVAADDPASLLPQVRKAVASFAPDLALLQPMTQRAQFENGIVDARLVARLSLCFAILAGILVATGLYGALAFNVTRRTAELGVRMAIGAQSGELLWLILRQCLTLAALGILIGLPLAIGAGRLLASQLFELEPYDPLTFGFALLGVILVCIAAGAIPARRAASVDPVVALRYE